MHGRAHAGLGAGLKVKTLKAKTCVHSSLRAAAVRTAAAATGSTAAAAAEPQVVVAAAAGAAAAGRAESRAGRVTLCEGWTVADVAAHLTL